MKLSIITISFIGGLVGGILAIVLLPVIFPGYLSGLIGENIQPRPTPTATPFVTPVDYTLQLTNDASFSSIAIQTFQGDKMTRQGSGIIVSSDGLILTTTDVVYGATVIQALLGDKIYKAQVVSANPAIDLALVKINGVSDLTISDIDNGFSFSSGQELLVTGKVSLLSKPEVFSQKANVNYTSDNSILLDTDINSFISGAKIISSAGKLAGMVFLRSGKAYAIQGQVLTDFLNRYLSK